MSDQTPPGWQTTKFKDLTIRLVNGGTPPTDVANYWKGTIPWITGADFTPSGVSDFRRFISNEAITNTSTNVINKGELLLVTRTGVGKLAIAPCDIAISQDITGVYADRSKVDMRFLYHRMRQGVQVLKKLNQGTSINGIIHDDLLSYAIDLPPLPQQQRIAEILSTVDEAIEATRALIAKTRAIKAGLMHDLFTRGVTADGHLRPPRNQAPHLYKPSPLGWIPKEWNIVELREVVPHATYGISSSLESKGTTPILRMNNVHDGEVDVSNLKYSSISLATTLWLRPDDVLFNRTNSIEHVGRTGIWRAQLSRASFASYLVRLEPNINRLSAHFLNAWLNWEATQIRIRKFATPGVHQVNINPTNLRRTTMALPNGIVEQDSIVKVLDSAATALRTYYSEASELEQLKRGLMHDLLTGRVAVPLAEPPAPAEASVTG